ncbi:MAG: EamA family transporter [Lachnospiraceae bacterium]|nr:EamA family transporter [Lachnospiraceae bacterium]
MKKTAPVCIIIAGILWGCIGIFVRNLNAAGIFSMEIVAIRAVVTSVCMGIFLLLYNARLLVIRLKDLWCFVGTGICSIVFFNYCYFKAISLTSLSIAAVLLYTAPAIVMVLSACLFGERFTVRKGVSLLFTFVGCVMVTGVITEPGHVTGMGILTGLGAGLGYALYSIFSRYAIERGYHTFTITFYTFLLAAVGSFFMNDGREVWKAAVGSWDVLAISVALGILCTVLPYLTYTSGLQFVENGKASILASVEPVTATLTGILLFGETISFFGGLGIVLVIAGLAICNSGNKDSQPA